MPNSIAPSLHGDCDKPFGLGFNFMEHYKNFSLENIVEETGGIKYTEQWKPIEGYEHYYEISTFGRVKSLRYAKTNNPGILKQSLIKAGYLRVELIRRGNRKFVHRLVAQAFINNPKNKPQVNHKLGKTKDNRVTELEWATYSEQQLHSINVLGHKPTPPPKPLKGKFNICAKSIYKIDKYTNEIICKYDCIVDAEKDTGIPNSRITSAAKGRYHTAGGFKWKYT